MADPKSIQDTAADAANELITHAVELIKKGAHYAHVADSLAFAERLSRHVQDIEDHERIGSSDVNAKAAPRVAREI